jgi:hypothetical protein
VQALEVLAVAVEDRALVGRGAREEGLVERWA